VRKGRGQQAYLSEPGDSSDVYDGDWELDNRCAVCDIQLHAHNCEACSARQSKVASMSHLLGLLCCTMLPASKRIAWVYLQDYCLQSMTWQTKQQLFVCAGQAQGQ